MTSPTSSTPRAPPVSPRGWRSPTTTSPSCSTHWTPAWLWRRGRCGRSVHSYAFDFSVWEIWGALLHGGRLVVVPDSVARSPKTSTPCWSLNTSACLTQTPSAVGVLSPEGLESAALVVGGEACPPEVVDRWAPGRVMVNVYGPTETTVCAAISAPLTGGVRGAADRFAGAGCGVVRAGRLVAAGAGRGGR